MATQNAINTNGFTGTGAVVLATSPTLITPTLGAAIATSINAVTISGSSTPTLAVTGTTTVSGSNTGDQTSITGNAATATALQTPRAINGVNFDGSAPITVTAAAGTLTGTTLNSTVVSSSLTSVGTLATLTVTAAPTFSAMTAGSVLFAGTAGLLSQDNAKFFWDDSNISLRLGANADTHNRTLYVTGNVSGGVATLERSNATTSAVVGTMIVKGISTGGTAGAGFGSSFQFALGDTGTNEVLTGNIQSILTGGTLASSPNASMAFTTLFNGTLTVGMTIQADTRVNFTQASYSGGGDNAIVFTPGTHTNLTASTENVDYLFLTNRTVQFATGALTNQRAISFNAPTYAFVGASTITNAATVSITGAPVAGTNATITNNAALWIQSGALRLGTAGSGTGLVNFFGTTSGIVGLTVAAAAGTGTLTLPGATDTLVGRATTDTLTNKTITSSTDVLGGVTMTLGSDASNDTYYRSSGGVLTRLANGTTGQFFGANTSAAPSWQTPSVTIVPRSLQIFQMNTATSGRLTQAVTSISGSGQSFSFGVYGATENVATSAQLGVTQSWLIFDNQGSVTVPVFSNNPTITYTISNNTSHTAGFTAQACNLYFGLGLVSQNGATGALVMTDTHVGFYIVSNGTTATVYGSQANGSSETRTSALTTVAANDVLEMRAVITSGTSVTYYVSKNRGADVTGTISGTMPSGSITPYMTFGLDTNGTTSSPGFTIHSMSYQ